MAEPGKSVLSSWPFQKSIPWLSILNNRTNHQNKTMIANLCVVNMSKRVNNAVMLSLKSEYNHLIV